MFMLGVLVGVAATLSWHRAIESSPDEKADELTDTISRKLDELERAAS